MSLFDLSLRRSSPETELLELGVDWDDVFMRELEVGSATAGGCLKDLPALDGPMAADPPLAIPLALPVPMRRLAAAYNRAGGLLRRLGRVTRLPLPTLLAVWYVESGGREAQPHRLRRRFDLARFYADWGARRRAAFARHFSRGARARDDRFRDTPATPFRRLHGDPATEEAALRAATRLAGATLARRALCVGEPELPLAEHRALGYDRPAEMLQAMDDERAQLIGLFDLIRSGAVRPNAPVQADELFTLLRAGRFTDFAARAHDPDVAPAVARALAATCAQARQLLVERAARAYDEPDAPDEPDEPLEPVDRPARAVVYPWPWPAPIRLWPVPSGRRPPHHGPHGAPHPHPRPRPHPQPRPSPFWSARHRPTRTALPRRREL